MDIYDRYEHPAVKYTDSTEYDMEENNVVETVLQHCGIDTKGAKMDRPTSPWNEIDNPKHYADTDAHGGVDFNVECIDWIEACLTTEEFDGYLKGCALKYIWRYKEKGGDKDLRKAVWYLTKLSKRV